MSFSPLLKKLTLFSLRVLGIYWLFGSIDFGEEVHACSIYIPPYDYLNWWCWISTSFTLTWGNMYRWLQYWDSSWVEWQLNESLRASWTPSVQAIKQHIETVIDQWYPNASVEVERTSDGVYTIYLFTDEDEWASYFNQIYSVILGDQQDDISIFRRNFDACNKFCVEKEIIWGQSQIWDFTLWLKNADMCSYRHDYSFSLYSDSCSPARGIVPIDSCGGWQNSTPTWFQWTCEFRTVFGITIDGAYYPFSQWYHIISNAVEVEIKNILDSLNIFYEEADWELITSDVEIESMRWCISEPVDENDLCPASCLADPNCACAISSDGFPYQACDISTATDREYRKSNCGAWLTIETWTEQVCVREDKNIVWFEEEYSTPEWFYVPSYSWDCDEEGRFVGSGSVQNCVITNTWDDTTVRINDDWFSVSCSWEAYVSVLDNDNLGGQEWTVSIVSIDPMSEISSVVVTWDNQIYILWNRCSSWGFVYEFLSEGGESRTGHVAHHGVCDGCHSGYCGNGIVEEWEECDDENIVSDDWCSEICNIEIWCWNWIIEWTEACDDWFNNDKSACTSECTYSVCGDGKLQWRSNDLNKSCLTIPWFSDFIASDQEVKNMLLWITLSNGTTIDDIDTYVRWNLHEGAWYIWSSIWENLVDLLHEYTDVEFELISRECPEWEVCLGWWTSYLCSDIQEGLWVTDVDIQYYGPADEYECAVGPTCWTVSWMCHDSNMLNYDTSGQCYDVWECENDLMTISCKWEVKVDDKLICPEEVIEAMSLWSWWEPFCTTNRNIETTPYRFKETCDDGNTIDGDGCSSMCEVEEVVECPLVACNLVRPLDYCWEWKEIIDTFFKYNESWCRNPCEQVVCGCENTWELPEEAWTECDDWNPYTYDDVIQEDGCSCQGEEVTECNACSVTPVCAEWKTLRKIEYKDEFDENWCRSNPCGTAVCECDWTGELPREAWTACDDGNTSTTNDEIQSDWCTCQWSSGWSWWWGRNVKFVAFCGNGVIEDEEMCDDGNYLNGDGCTSDCQEEKEGEQEKLITKTETLNGTNHTIVETEREKLIKAPIKQKNPPTSQYQPKPRPLTPLLKPVTISIPDTLPQTGTCVEELVCC